MLDTPAFASRTGRRILLLALPCLLWLHFFLGATLLHQVNFDRLTSDQQNNIEMARASVGDIVPMRTDGVVNPLWPWIAARFAPVDAEDDATFFMRGKWANLVLTACGLVGIVLLAARTWSLGGVLVLALLSDLGVLIPHAVWFQPEPLFFLLFLATWMGGLLLLQRNPLGLYAGVGFVAGLAYLAKASVPPLLVVFVSVSGLRWLLAIKTRDPVWSPRRHWLGVFVLVAVFAAVLVPRAWYGIQRFGDALHSYPKYWMWQDDFGKESVPFMAKYGTREALATLSAEDRPSRANWFRTHSTAEFIQRLSTGTMAKISQFVFPEKKWGGTKRKGTWRNLLAYRGLYLNGLILLLAVAAMRTGRGIVRPEVICSVALVAGAFALYALAYGWYHPIGRGDRFMMSLYMPLVASLVWGIELLLRQERARMLILAGYTIVLGFLLMHLIRLVQLPLFSA